MREPRGGTGGCYAKIQLAVDAAAANDVINVAAGTYAEGVVIGKALSLIGAGAGQSFINATNQPNGILADGLNNPGLHDVTIAGFIVENALYEGVLLLNTTGVTVRDDHIVNNDKEGPNTSGTACVGQPDYETDESFDCGGGLHLLGAVDSFVSGNAVSGNADGIVITDETREAHHNAIISQHGQRQSHRMRHCSRLACLSGLSASQLLDSFRSRQQHDFGELLHQ